MGFWSDEEDARAKALISTIMDGYDGGEVDATLAFLVTDVDDWEALSLELAAHCATLLIVMARMLDVDPYELFSRYIRSHG